MSSLLAYSGITTKTRAMAGKLLSDDDFRELAELSSVAEAVAYLKNKKEYQELFKNIEETALHRGDIEKLLQISKYQDFTKLYQFANGKQRNFLDLYFLQYEIILLKYCLRIVFDHRSFDLDLSAFKAFFEKHSNLSLERLTAAQTLEELVAELKGTELYGVLSRIGNIEKPTLFDYENTLDLYHFRRLWRMKGKYLGKDDVAFVTKTFGSKFDLLNIQWIYRSIKFYKLPAEHIYALLIPIQYRLKQDEVRAMTEAQSDDEFQNILKGTYYAKTFSRIHHLELQNLEAFYYSYLSMLHRREGRQNPYSIAVLDSFLYQKDEEIRKIITVVEGIRYGLNPQDILKYILIE